MGKHYKLSQELGWAPQPPTPHRPSSPGDKPYHTGVGEGRFPEFRGSQALDCPTWEGLQVEVQEDLGCQL